MKTLKKSEKLQDAPNKGSFEPDPEVVIQQRLISQNQSLEEEKVQALAELKAKILMAEADLKSLRNLELAEARKQKKTLSLKNKLISTLIQETPRVQACKTLNETKTVLQNIIQDSLELKEVRIEFLLLSSNLLESDTKPDLSVFRTLIEDQFNLLKLRVQCFTKKALKDSHRKSLDLIFDFFGNYLLHLAVKAEIKTLQQQWTHVFRTLPYPIVVITPDLEILQSNSGDHIPEGHCFEVLFNRSTPCDGCPVLKKAEAKDSGNSSEIRSQFGGVIEVHSSLYSEAPLTYLNIYQDLTEKILLQEFQSEANEKLELGLYTSTLAHELNNPLTGIVTMSQLIQSETPSKEVRALTQQIEVTSKRLLEPIQNILFFSKEPLDEESVTLDFLIKKVTALSALVGLEVKTDLEPSELKMQLTPRQYQVLLLALTQGMKSFVLHNQTELPFQILSKQKRSLSFMYFCDPQTKSEFQDLKDSPERMIQLCKHLLEFNETEQLAALAPEASPLGAKWAQFTF